MASITARLAKFSLAMSSRPRCWRWSSWSIRAAIAGSPWRSEALWSSGMSFSLGFDLLDPALVPSPFEGRIEPGPQDVEPFLFGDEPGGKDQDVRVVVR